MDFIFYANRQYAFGAKIAFWSHFLLIFRFYVVRVESISVHVYVLTKIYRCVCVLQQWKQK